MLFLVKFSPSRPLGHLKSNQSMEQQPQRAQMISFLLPFPGSVKRHVAVDLKLFVRLEEGGLGLPSLGVILLSSPLHFVLHIPYCPGAAQERERESVPGHQRS